MADFSRRKFFAVAEDDAGQALNWPGTGDGFPVLGPAADTTKDEYDDIPLILNFRSRVFQLADEEQKAAFDVVQDRIVNGWYRLVKRTDRWPDTDAAPTVWLEWVEIYGESPTTKHPHQSAQTASS